MTKAVSPPVEEAPAAISATVVRQAGHMRHLLWRASVRFGYGGVNSMIGRTSMLPRRPGGIFEATWIASFRSRASIRKNPPSCSYVSANGPSVIDSLPFPVRMVVAA